MPTGDTGAGPDGVDMQQCVCVRVWFWCPLKFIHKAVSDAHKDKVRVHSSVILL